MSGRLLSKAISEKQDMIGKLRADLEQLKKTTKNSVDEQIVIAEVEYRLVKEELALLSLQEKHWESAALWDAHAPHIQKEAREVLYSYIRSVEEKGAAATLHVSDHLFSDNSVLVSSQESLPKVEWAHHSTDLQAGDRLVEVNGHLVVGRQSGEVRRLLTAGPLCRLVFVRALSPYQLMKRGGGCKEASNLRQELTAVVDRLNRRMAENARLFDHKFRMQKEIEELKGQNHRLKLQVASLQTLLLYLFQMLEKNNFEASRCNLCLESLLQHHPIILDILKRPPILSDVLSLKTIPSLEFNSKGEGDQSLKSDQGEKS